MSITTPWAMPPNNVFTTLQPKTVHIWRVALNDSSEQVSRFQSYLSDDEVSKANQYRFPLPRNQFIVTRCILRILLSRYLGISHDQLHFETQPQGKPKLVTPSSCPLQFNVSHTRGMALIGFTLQHAIGIDVEWVARKIHDRDIAKRYFSPRESAELDTLPQVERTHRFFTYWTCKEAYLKMQGTGITGGLAQCELSLQSGQTEVRLSLQNQKEPKNNYSVYQIEIGSEHLGAVALASPSPHISYWNWLDRLAI